jgi:hypothetical protein
MRVLLRLFFVPCIVFAMPAHSGEGPLKLALKTKPPQCVPVLCWVKNIGWCMCDPCTYVNDCRAATGKAQPLTKGTIQPLDRVDTLKKQ